MRRSPVETGADVPVDLFGAPCPHAPILARQREELAPMPEQTPLFAFPTGIRGQLALDTGGLTRDEVAAKAHPEGTAITTTVHGIGGRSEKVSGTVIGHKRGQLVVKTPCHGNIAIAPADVEPLP